MNHARRKDIEAARALLDEARGLLECVAEAEREAYDNMPEGLQSSERGEASEAAADALDEAVQYIDDACSSCDEAAT